MGGATRGGTSRRRLKICGTMPTYRAPMHYAVTSDGVRIAYVTVGAGSPLALQCSGILCRGVLNDFVDDDARESVFAVFAGTLRREGVLSLDVREWEGTRDRQQSRMSVENPLSKRGQLT